MTIKYDKRGRRRDYRKEYVRDGGTPKDIKDRSARNYARSLLKVKGKGEVHHKDGNPRNNSRKNLMIVSKKKNTTMSNKARASKR